MTNEMTAEEAIRWLDAIKKYYIHGGDEAYDKKRMKAIDKAIDKAIKALEPRWIPCSERLPEENGQYLITVKYKPEADYENIYAEHGEWTDGRWDMFCFGHCGEVEDIIAWMPLPKPYKGE